jgi:hypothetical protein
MTERTDIMDGLTVTPLTNRGLVYTCKCGWIDIGHASPRSSRPNVGAANLWRTVRDELGPRSLNGLWHRVTYSQTMGKFGLTAGLTQDFAIRLGLSAPDKESVALAIFMEVSGDFESYQGSAFPYALQSSRSSFSAEDLVSNLIGFFSAVRPGPDYIKLCQPVSKAAAEGIWDSYGHVGRSMNKVREFRPLLFPCDDCPDGPPSRRLGVLPSFLQSIHRAQRGSNFRPWREDDRELAESPTPSHPRVAASGESYRINAGDTVSRIAAVKYGDMFLWLLLYDANRSVIGSDPNRIFPGQVLTIPPLSSFTVGQLEEARRRSRNRSPGPRLSPPR